MNSSEVLDRNIKKILADDVKFENIPKDALNKMKRSPTLLQGEKIGKDYIRPVSAGPITQQESILFRSYVDKVAAPKQRQYHSFEDYGMQDQKGPQWTGTKCTVGDDSREYFPVIHKPSDHMSSRVEEWVASVASMTTELTSEGIVKVNMPQNVADGPLSVLMDDISPPLYANIVVPILTPLVGQDRSDEKYSEAVYRAVSTAKPREKKDLLDATYALMSKVKISYTKNRDSPGVDVKSANGFKMEWEGTRRLGKDLVPFGRPVAISSSFRYTPKVVKAGKIPSNVALDQFQSSFPPKLLTYYGFLGHPSSVQRTFMIMRPYLEVFQCQDPKESLRPWLKAGGYDYCDSTLEDEETVGTTLASFRHNKPSSVHTKYAGELALVDNPGSKPSGPKPKLIRKDYGEKAKPTAIALYYGTVTFDKDFFSEYTIVSYRPPDNRKFFYAPKKADRLISQLPLEWADFKLTIVRSELQLSEMLVNYMRTLTSCFMKGIYQPHVKQYDDLKYPLPRQGQYIDLDPEEVKEEARSALTAAEHLSGMNNSFLACPDDDDGDGDVSGDDVTDASYRDDDQESEDAEIELEAHYFEKIPRWADDSEKIYLSYEELDQESARVVADRKVSEIKIKGISYLVIGITCAPEDEEDGVIQEAIVVKIRRIAKAPVRRVIKSRRPSESEFDDEKETM